jgi:two-component system, LuxR family, response regulator FixJ
VPNLSEVMSVSDFELESPAAVKEVPAKDTPPDLLSNPVVYVVEDEPVAAEAIAMTIKTMGIEPLVFHNPARFWESFVAAYPRAKLLVTDYLMSPFNGLELIQRCKQIEPGLKTILYSGYVDEGIMASAVVKPDKFLLKPVKMSVLIETVRNLLGD